MAHWALAAVAAWMTATLPSLRADSIELISDRDATLYEQPEGLLANGAGQFLFAGRTKDGERRRAALHFDLTALPPGSTVLAASLTLTMSKGISNDHPASLHRALGPWGEGDSDAEEEEGQGAPAAAGDATWVHAFFDTDEWELPGGDSHGIGSGSALVGGPGKYTWTSTPAMVGDVQGWLDEPGGNYGWLLLGREDVDYTAKRFNTREHLDAATRPVLRIEFAPPCPADCEQEWESGVLDLFDVLCFVNAFNAETESADCTGDGLHDLLDFLCFMSAFNEGCP